MPTIGMVVVAGPLIDWMKQAFANPAVAVPDIIVVALGMAGVAPEVAVRCDWEIRVGRFLLFYTGPGDRIAHAHDCFERGGIVAVSGES